MRFPRRPSPPAPLPPRQIGLVHLTADSLSTLTPLWSDHKHPAYCLASGIEGTETTPAIPETAMPFDGYLVTAEVVIREQNRVISLGSGPEGERRARVLGLGRFTVILNGVGVYSPPSPCHRAEDLLLQAAYALLVLRRHPVHWWDPDSWNGRLVWYQGTPSYIQAYEPEQGRVWLAAEPGYGFPPDPEAVAAGTPSPLPVVAADIVFSAVDWNRRTPSLPEWGDPSH